MRRLTLVLVIVLALSFLAVAQEFPRAEFNAGYSYQRVQTRELTSFSAANFSGVAGGLNFNFHQNVGVFADIGYYKCTKKGVTDWKQTSFLFGPQFTYRGESRLSPFGRFGIGAVHVPDNYVVAGNPAATKWAYSFGGGADVRVNNHLSVRAAQVDYIRTHFFDKHESNVRLSFGIVFKMGTKTK